jgi:hypothetical protein
VSYGQRSILRLIVSCVVQNNVATTLIFRQLGTEQEDLNVALRKTIRYIYGGIAKCEINAQLDLPNQLEDAHHFSLHERLCKASAHIS